MIERDRPPWCSHRGGVRGRAAGRALAVAAAVLLAVPAPALALGGGGSGGFGGGGGGGFGGGGFGGGPGGGSGSSSSIATWVSSSFHSRTVNGVTIYDLTQPLTSSGSGSASGGGLT